MGGNGLADVDVDLDLDFHENEDFMFIVTNV